MKLSISTAARLATLLALALALALAYAYVPMLR